MTKNLGRVIAVAAMFAAAPAAQAASMVNPNGINGSALLQSGSPLTWNVAYAGWGGDPAHALPGLSAFGTFNFLGTINSGKTFQFSYTLANTSSATSRLSVFGFDIDPTDNLVVTTGNGDVFDLGVLNPKGTIPSGFGKVDFCLKTDGQANNCNNGYDGVDRGSSTSGTFNLVYSTAPTSVTLDRFFVRYQTVSGLVGDANVTSAIGRGTPMLVPEPATWAMMIAGFGLVGGALRRRRTSPAFA